MCLSPECPCRIFSAVLLPEQEQSQAPALGGRDTQDSFEALQRLLEFARARSSKQILLMTWGYLHGDPADHPAIFPDYHAMQARRWRSSNNTVACHHDQNGSSS